MTATHWPGLSPVEQRALAASPFEKLTYAPEEKIPVITVSHFPALGQLTAMRFLEWAQGHPGGVMALPTGKTPEHFIHWVGHFLRTWHTPGSRAVLEKAGVDPARRPEMGSLHFVQIDEFYPIHPEQENSFYYYVKKFYLDGFGLDPAKALLIDSSRIGLEGGQTLASVWPDFRVDLSLRTRQPVTEMQKSQQRVLRRIDEWCQEYEQQIRALGGIGFFLGGIGPDGHIGFNIRGSDHFSTTRLMETNYETQAAAATDLGGIEIARQRLVITMGLGTITFNPQCVAIIMAAGEAKAGIVADAVQGPSSVLIPASALRALANARFFLTTGAARLLRQRQVSLVSRFPTVPDEQVEMALVDLALSRKKRILDLTLEEAKTDPLAHLVTNRRAESFPQLQRLVHDRLIHKIEAGSPSQQHRRFLHTEPHHDDLMLGCMAYIVRNIRNASNLHHFVTLTSGFTAVTNHYMLDRLQQLRVFLATPQCARLHAEGYFDPLNQQGRNRDIWLYLDGIAGQNADMRDEGAARRLLRNVIEIYKKSDFPNLFNRLDELQHYFEHVYPGKKDSGLIQQLKGMCREWEAECLWGYFGWQSSHIHHLRLGFYTGDVFSPTPTLERDVQPILELLARVEPEVISVAFDPEGSGPDTHYKVLQAMNEAVQRHAQKTSRSDLRILGYRNVWYRFHPAEANLYVPVSLNLFSVMEKAFLNTFVSQRHASFPSYELDGPFCELAQRIQVEQYQMLKTCLGRQWFAEHPSPLIRATRGLVFLKEMDIDTFSRSARKLRAAAEALEPESV